MIPSLFPEGYLFDISLVLKIFDFSYNAPYVILNYNCKMTCLLSAAARMLNPVALFHSASSRSTSSRFFLASSSSREDPYESSSSDYSEESNMISGSHQCTLDRLYTWEKKLYEEVKVTDQLP